MSIVDKYGHLLYFYLGVFLLFLGLVFAQDYYENLKRINKNGIENTDISNEESHTMWNGVKEAMVQIQGTGDYDNSNKSGTHGQQNASEQKRDISSEQTKGVHEEKKKIALTFDDGPSIYTNSLLDGLKERGAKASFFLLGECIPGKEDVVKRIHEEGNLIGNHTYKHERISIVSDKKACERIQLTSDMIFDITGQYTVFVRPPYGEWKKGLDLKVQMIPVFWDIDSLDWTTHNTKAVVNRVVKGAHEGAIILMHDCSKSSVEAALEIIDQLQKQGYTFVTVADMVFE